MGIFFAQLLIHRYMLSDVGRPLVQRSAGRRPLNLANRSLQVPSDKTQLLLNLFYSL